MVTVHPPSSPARKALRPLALFYGKVGSQQPFTTLFRPRKRHEGPGLDLRQMGSHSLIQPQQILPHARHVLGTDEPQTHMQVLMGLMS